MNAMTELKKLRIPFMTSNASQLRLRQLDVEYDPETRILWTYMKQAGKPCFNLGLLQDFKANDQALEDSKGKTFFDSKLFPIDYVVIASKTPNVFSYGGDLALFSSLIKSRDRDALLHYAKLCIDGIYARIKNFDSSVITISLVQGEALGGGFELALTSNFIIAEETARMGFPEILFNLFPGMGAYSLLTRRIGVNKAEEIILGGKIYEAHELKEIGLVDLVVPTHEGENAVYSFAHQNSKRLNGMRAMYQSRHHTHPITYGELMKITEIWVDAALQLEDRDLRMMSRLVRAQMKQQELAKHNKPIEENLNVITVR